MDCQLLELPEGLTCNFRRNGISILQREESKRELQDLIAQGRARIEQRVDGLLDAKRDQIDGAISDLRSRRDEIRALIEACDEDCLISYFKKYFENRPKKKSSKSRDRENLFEQELRGYFARHPEIERELQKWYTLYNGGNPKKSELLKFLPPLLESVENRTGVTFGFIPLKGGFITILRRPDGSYYALQGETLSSGKTLESAIAPFAQNTTILQIIDKSGKVIGTLETPLSRSLDALLFIDRHQSVWSLLTSDPGKALDISYHQDGHKINLRTPRKGVQVEFSEGEETLSGIGRVSGKRFALGYNFNTGFSESTFTLGRGSLRGETFRIEGTEARLSNHIHFGEIPFSKKSIGVHGIGFWNAKVQGNIMKPDTGKIEGKQALVLSWDQYYLGYGRAIHWTPDLIEKKYSQFTKSPLMMAGVRYGDMSFEASSSSGTTQLSLRGQGKSSSLEATIEYQKRAHALLSDTSLRAQVSFVAQF